MHPRVPGSRLYMVQRAKVEWHTTTILSLPLSFSPSLYTRRFKRKEEKAAVLTASEFCFLRRGFKCARKSKGTTNMPANVSHR